MEKNPELKTNIQKANDIYSEENLFSGSSIEGNEEIKQEFEDWFKVKIQGVVKSYKIHENGSLQLKFQEIVEKTVGGVTYNDYADKSIRITQEKPFSESFAKSLLNKAVEIIDVKETAQYKKIAEGQYDFNKVERYVYSADNVKAIDKAVENGYQLFKVFSFTVKDVLPAVKYDSRKRQQVLDKDKAVLLYETVNDTLSTLHKITLHGSTFAKAQELKNKEVVILDLQQIGKNNFCSKIKVK
ncbi:hypothetical protein [Sulfurimonas sp.]|uniref:hypothetical protein n=1 Tax=Sulfurimonas sp. TaxID=2022749 RepID=UPI003D0A8989